MPLEIMYDSTVCTEGSLQTAAHCQHKQKERL